MSSFSVDWSTIRPLNGGRENGFEELCAQLARSETPKSARFVRKGTPDAGVECYTILPDKTEWAWQAKYFNTLGQSQLQQIDKSVKTALDKHPNLVRYYVCMPIDLPDARIAGQKSAREKWDTHVLKWRKWANGLDKEVEFILWGNSELVERLAQSVHVGRVRFWFNKHGFDNKWFTDKLNEALSAAGPRYTPEVHVELPIAQDFDAFGRTQRFFDRTKSLAINIRKSLRKTERSIASCRNYDLEKAKNELFEAVEVILEGLNVLEFTPAEKIPLNSLLKSINAAISLAEVLYTILEQNEQRDDYIESEEGEITSQSLRHSNPSREKRVQVARLQAELRRVDDIIRRAERLANNSVLIIRGDAGTGKTHLLCDVAKHRVAANQPTVLLMGQRLVTNDSPWTQVLQQLDLVGLSGEDFVGALESAAQASGHRALLLIDAVNEGTGRIIWPNHMAAFLAQVERSAWVGVVMSVRSSYEDSIVPEQVRDRAIDITHRGFLEQEYDAIRTFFVHYNLELPSTPLLNPEFGNPLFLKTLCQGLRKLGKSRIPRGLHGITAVFELYLKAVNEQLAQQLGYDPRVPFVRQALDAVATVMANSNERWLSLKDAKGAVDILLPGRGFEQSLYRGIVAEGILAEEAIARQDGSTQYVVYVAYERFADHLIAKTLLDSHLDHGHPRLAFEATGGLAFIADTNTFVAPGLLEALWVQVAERCGVELITLVPQIYSHYSAGDAFRKSLIWRAVDAFSDDTKEIINLYCSTKRQLHRTLDALLTITTFPQHPLNSRFLDQRLRLDPMADRDAWWSIYLHYTWSEHGPVDRLVDWALSIDSDTVLDDEVVNLAGTALAWMLTSSNRFLRDRATKALVNLYSGRIPNIIKLVAQFSDVDDVYLVERVFASAYGVAMRSRDPKSVGTLAELVYERIFLAGKPPTHILLRDYARGIIERALYLDSDIKMDLDLVRPPYISLWPDIPTVDENQWLIDWSKFSYNSGAPEWAFNRIVDSVLHDDFARYVIGTNSSSSGDWLSISLDQPSWEPPTRHPEVLRDELIDSFSHEELAAWNEYMQMNKIYKAELQKAIADVLNQNDDRSSKFKFTGQWMSTNILDARTAELDAAEDALEQAIFAVKHALTNAHSERLLFIKEVEAVGGSMREPPRLGLELIQQYILKRVFELGWNVEQFGYFDRHLIGYSGREAPKAERIGKKYQWIAYHEIMAFISDRFQYRERYREEDGDKVYDGPWQKQLRDIDPSCPIRFQIKNVSRPNPSPVWWNTSQFESWSSIGNEREWLMRTNNLPNVEDLIQVREPGNNIQWLNAQGSFRWQQSGPADREPTEVNRGDIQYLCTGYMINQEDTDAFLKWAEGVDFWGRWMPDPATIYRVFLGEHAWSPASRYFEQYYYGDSGWNQPGQGCPVKIRTAAFEYLNESSGFDCLVDESYTYRLPVRELMEAMDIHWSGSGADCVNGEGKLAAQDPSAHQSGPSALLLRAELIRELQRKMELTLCWTVLGEKRILTPGWGGGDFPFLRMTGAFVLEDSGLTGFIKYILDDPSSSSEKARVVDIYRKS